MKKIYSLLFLAIASFSANAQVVISQVYGAGGNNGATYTHDFVELFNRGDVPVTLTGHTLQYASNNGTFNASNIQTLPAITIQPGQYYLIQQSGGTNGIALPTPDLITTVADNGVILALAASNGKIALANSNVAVTSPTSSNVVDFVGFGTANIYEGTGPTAAISTVNSAFRANNGCQDTNDNAADFTVGPVAPRNSASPVNPCSTSGIKDNNIAGLKMFPNPVSGSVLNITSDNNLDKTIVVFDVLGKQVLNTKVVNGTVNVAGLTAGVYIVKITEEGKTATRKLVVK